MLIPQYCGSWTMLLLSLLIANVHKKFEEKKTDFARARLRKTANQFHLNAVFICR